MENQPGSLPAVQQPAAAPAVHQPVQPAAAPAVPVEQRPPSADPSRPALPDGIYRRRRRR